MSRYCLVLLLLLAAAPAYADQGPAAGADEFKTITKFNGVCVKAVYLDADILSDCVGPAVRIVGVDGTSIMAFKLSEDRGVMFISADSVGEKQGSWPVSKISILNGEYGGPLDATDASCEVSTSNGAVTTIMCAGKADGKTLAFTYDVTGAPDIQELQSGSSKPLMFEYWDDLNGVCDGYSLDGKAQDPKSCIGYYHVGYTGGRVTLMFALAGTPVVFSSAHDMVMTGGHGEMPISFIYLGAARMPALGDCTTDRDWHGSAKIVCDAAATVEQKPLLVHVEFTTKGLTAHHGGTGEKGK